MHHTLTDVEALLDHRTSSFSNLENALEAAEETCNEVLRAEPRNFDARLCLGRLWLERSENERAIEHFGELVSERTQDWRNHFYLGLALQRQGAYAQASDAFVEALRSQAAGKSITLNSIAVRIMSELGRTYLAGGANAEAERYYTAVLEFVKATVKSTEEAAGELGREHYLSPSGSVYPILYIPVEIKARELPAKLMIAAHAAAAGLKVVIGQTWALFAGNFSDLPPGIILFKTLNSIDAHNAKVARDAGHLTCALDEEAFGRSTEEPVYRQNTDQKALACMDLVMVQGVAHRAMLERLHPEAKARLSVTGSPRADLLRDIKSRRALPESWKRKDGSHGYVLICTMFGNINPAGRGFANTARTTLDLAGAHQSSEHHSNIGSTFDECVALELGLFGQTRALVEDISRRFPNQRVVVRPHPAEDGGIWSNMFSGMENVTVRGDGPLSDWLPDASAMVYLPGCATGIEAKLAGVPAVCFRGRGAAKKLGVGVSEQVNVQIMTSDGVCDWLADLGSAKAYNAAEVAETALINECFFSVPHESAAGHMAAAIKNLQEQYARSAPLPMNHLLGLGSARTRHFTARPFHRKKFPVTPASEIISELNTYAKSMEGGIAFQTQAIADNVFLIEALRVKDQDEQK